MACFGLTRELANEGVEVIFVLPKKQDVVGNSRFVFADKTFNVRVKEVDSGLKPYGNTNSLVHYIEGYDDKGNPHYS